MIVSHKILLGSTAIVLAMLAVPAAAQSDSGGVVAGQNDGDDSVIVVTAQRREEALQDVPIAVSAFQGEQLQSSGVDGLRQLSQMAPSLVVPEGGSQSVPYIRGVGSRNITPGNESSAAVYIDGVYQTDKTGILLQTFPEVESIQVLRGPQGTLFGRNATSGAILISTKRPSQNFGGMVEGTFGTDDRGARAYINTGLGENLAFSVSGFYRYETPYIINRNPSNGIGKRTGEEETYGLRANLLFESGDFSALLQGNYIKGYTTPIMAMQPAPGSPFSIGEAASGIDIRNPKRAYYGEVPPEVRYDSWGTSLHLDYDLGDIGISSTSAYTRSGSGVQLDLDLSPAPVFWFDTDLNGRTWQQELLVSSKGSSPFQWLLGGFYINYRDGYSQLDQYVGLPVPDPLQPLTVPQRLLELSALGLGPTSGLAYIDLSTFVTIESVGLFGEASYELGQGTKITAGLRYTDETATLDADNGSVTYVPDGTGGVIAIPQTIGDLCTADPQCDGLSTGFSELTYRVVLDHKFSDDFLVYASYNRGFKSGVYNISSLSPRATEPETIDAFEVGLKSQLFDRKLTLNLAGYYYKYDNLQVPVVDPATNTQISINAAKATISGLEVEFSLRPDDRLTLNGSFSTYFKSEYDSFPNCEIYRPAGVGLALATNADCSGEDLPVTPNIMASLAANYKLPLGRQGELELAGLLSYTDEFDHATHGFYPAGVDAGGNPYPAGEGRAPIQKSLTTLNLSATFRPLKDNFYVTIWGRDLLNQGDRVFRNMQTTTFGYSTTLGRGITGGVTMGFKFGS